MHLAADPVTAEPVHDPERDAMSLFCPPRRQFESIRHVGELVSGPHGEHPLFEDLSGCVVQRLHTRIEPAHSERPRGIAVPTIEDGPTVDRHQIALREHGRRARDAVDDDLVHRRADGSRKALVPLERRHRPGVPDQLLDDRIQLRGGDTGSRRIAGCDERPPDDAAGRLHRVQLAGGASGDVTLAGSTEHGGGQRPSAASARPLISSTSPTASIVVTWSA